MIVFPSVTLAVTLNKTIGRVRQVDRDVVPPHRPREAAAVGANEARGVNGPGASERGSDLRKRHRDESCGRTRDAALERTRPEAAQEFIRRRAWRVVALGSHETETDQDGGTNANPAWACHCRRPSRPGSPPRRTGMFSSAPLAT